MTSKAEKDKSKQIVEKSQSLLNALLRDEDNKYCVDCDSKGPRWASWNLGVFLCIRCAGIHRKLGVHISKVKSVNLDTWTPEQVVSLQQMGNSRARAVYEANLPDNFRRPQNDSSLESFIQAKYEHKKYIAREWVQPPIPIVDWEKEIDEEIERQRVLKKSLLERKQMASVEIPQLPKPKTSSPKPNRISPAPGIIERNQKLQADLLEFQNGEDAFCRFVSACTFPDTNPTPTESDTLKTEEESFFNQTVPTEQEKVKLTKDSILALYANAPTNAINPNFATQSQGGGGINQQGFLGYALQNLQIQNTPSQQFQQFPGQFTFRHPSAGQFALNNQFQAPQVNNVQYAAQPNNFINGTNFFANSQLQPGVTNGDVPPNQQLQQSEIVGQTPLTNPFFGNSITNVQQQFENLTLAGQTSNVGPTVATNLWQ